MAGKKLLRVGIFSLAILLIVGVLIYLLTPKEPRYQDRTLSQWLTDFAATSPGSQPDPKREAAANAVYQIGTNANPWLLKWASGKESKVKRALKEWINSHTPFHLDIQSDLLPIQKGSYGFGLLHEKAKPAYPALIQWTFDKDPRLRLVGLTCLNSSKPDKEIILPVLRRLVKDPDERVQFGASLKFFDYAPEEADALLNSSTNEIPPASKK
jgi:hypothetical protein